MKKFLLVAHIFINSSPGDRKRREIVRLSRRWGVARLPNEAQNSNFHGRPFSTLYKTWSVLEIQISFLKAETKIMVFGSYFSKRTYLKLQLMKRVIFFLDMAIPEKSNCVCCCDKILMRDSISALSNSKRQFRMALSIST